MQVLTVLTMERPVSFAAEDIRDEKVRPMSKRHLRHRLWRLIRKSTIGQGSTSNPPDRARGHPPWAICGSQRKTGLS